MAKTSMAKTKLGGVAVVCTKCAKRQGVRSKDVRGLLRDAYRALDPVRAEDGKRGKRRKLCVLESGCLGPCPKRSVAVATGASLAAGRVLLLDPLAGVAGARAALFPEFGPHGPAAAPVTGSAQEGAAKRGPRAGLAARSDVAGPGEDPPGPP